MQVMGNEGPGVHRPPSLQPLPPLHLPTTVDSIQTEPSKSTMDDEPEPMDCQTEECIDDISLSESEWSCLQNISESYVNLAADRSKGMSHLIFCGE